MKNCIIIKYSTTINNDNYKYLIYVPFRVFYFLHLDSHFANEMLNAQIH